MLDIMEESSEEWSLEDKHYIRVPAGEGSIRCKHVYS